MLARERARRYHHSHLDEIKARNQRAERKEQNRANSRKQVQWHRAYLTEIKLARGCVDCGYCEDPAELHFDHRPGETKLHNVGSMNGYSRAKVDAEIAKCDVRCAPCHRARHAKERG